MKPSNQLKSGASLAPATGYADPTDDPAYQVFIEESAKHCHCRANNCPCDGVLAGGLCDMVQEEEPERSYDEDE